MRPSPSKSSLKHCSIRDEQPGRHFVVAALGRDHRPQLGVEVEGLQAVGATPEVGMDRVVALLRQLAVEKGLELSHRLVAVIHWSVLSRARPRLLQ